MTKHLPCLRATPPMAFASRHLQQGVTLLVALVVLLVMTITGLALVRTSTLGAGVSGSLALKQAATSGADLGLETGLAKLEVLAATGTSALDANNSALGYYASVDPKASAQSLAWDSAPVATTNDGLGNEVRYLIHRLCSKAEALNAAGQSCVMPQGEGCSGSSESIGSVSSCTQRPMYRITAKVSGPRDTESYVQMSTY